MLYFAGDFLLNDNRFQLIYWNGVDSIPLAYTKVHSPIYAITGVQGAPIISHDLPNTIKFWTGWHWENRRLLDASAQLLTTSNDHAYLVSEFPFFGSHASSTIAEFDRSGNLSSTLGLTGSPMTWTLLGTHLLASSDWTRIDTQPISTIVAIDQAAWRDTGLKPHPGKLYFSNNQVYAILIVQNHDWWEVNIDRWNGTNWQDVTGLHIQSNGSLPQFVVWQNQLYFTKGNTVHRLEGTTSHIVFEFDGAPLQLVNINDRYLYIGGAFNKVGSQALGSLVRWNGFFWQAPQQAPNGAVERLAASEKYLYLSGKFTHVGSSPSLGIASFSLASEPEPIFYRSFIPQVNK
ncbi:hypothetical protein [Herpetosiphon sp. NSE202]|uniref:hypothetical protein n=1 Tax=Herpetosiphon sp. NSE202 TaxID=3351349 RepID=UPI0036363BDE